MQRAKHLLDFGGVPLILQTARLVMPLVRKITVIGARRNTVPVGIRTIPDDDFGIRSEVNSRSGPLAGIVTALSHSGATWNLILACDMPYLNIGWLAWLLNRAANSGAEAVIPRTRRGFEPLAAVYHRDCCNVFAQSLMRRVPKITDALKLLRLEIVKEAEWREFDPDGLVINNLNTPADYRQAQAWFRDQGYITIGGKLERTPQPPAEILHPPINRPPLVSLPPAKREDKPPLITFCAPLAKRRTGTKSALRAELAQIRVPPCFRMK
jgi:molybdopterin-guanine dinucleotide biosynthesis protein A